MRNSFKEVIYAIIKDLVKLDLNLVCRLHCDKFDTGNNILHYSLIYDRFVAVFEICEAVYLNERNNFMSKQRTLNMTRDQIELEINLKMYKLLNSYNKLYETPKTLSDETKPSSKYLTKLERKVIRTILMKRKAVLAQKTKFEIDKERESGQFSKTMKKSKYNTLSAQPRFRKLQRDDSKYMLINSLNKMELSQPPKPSPHSFSRLQTSNHTSIRTLTSPTTPTSPSTHPAPSYTKNHPGLAPQTRILPSQVLQRN